MDVIAINAGPRKNHNSYDTWQFDDYSKYTAKMFDLERKAKIEAEQFPLYCKEALQ